MITGGEIFMFSWLKSFWQEEEGQGMTEYGLILGIIAIGVIGIYDVDSYRRFRQH